MNNTTDRTISTSEAAALLGRTQFSVRAFCRRKSLGELRAGRLFLSAADVEFIRANIRESPGNPLLSDPAEAAALGSKGGTAKAINQAKKKAAKKKAAKKKPTHKKGKS